MTTQSLFGGAIQCLVPADWRDVSDIRQVPVSASVCNRGRHFIVNGLASGLAMTNQSSSPLYRIIKKFGKVQIIMY